MSKCLIAFFHMTKWVHSFFLLQVSSLNDMLACDKAVPAEPLSWQVPEELVDLYLVYMKNNQPAEKLSRLQFLLRISDLVVDELRRRIDSGDLPNGDEEEAFVF